ncbi:hypothetical protein N656DRAFT_776770 [Canariomyces notabilis]|uniref:Uncharacterized protein n=1 Tax=Canariomyces notabilis TaxID=2074819 RepID=A0AAN6THP0_9PEZI|nr:hypothetical protein N656DRAFT_776770 [Canariomyces arenarius]
MAQPFSIAQIVSPPEEPPETMDLVCGGCRANGPCACAEEVLRYADLAMSCGKCSLGTRCECLEKTLGSSVTATDLKRPLPPNSPSSPVQEEKRQRSDAGLAMETDFTHVFASQGNREPASSLCMCADAAMMASAGPQITEQTQTHTPPPSENDVVPLAVEVTATGAIKLPGLRDLQRTRAAPPHAVPARAGGCGPNGPGTCEQCLADPKSGLFCRSLAANFEKNASAGGNGGGCCGNGGPGGCCKAGQNLDPAGGRNSGPSANTAAGNGKAAVADGTATPGSVLSIPCAEAYKTLASHRHFDEAADDIGSWLPKLKALPAPRLPPAAGGRAGYLGARRAPIEVEAASIMSVLKDFDVRFGRGE